MATHHFQNMIIFSFKKFNLGKKYLVHVTVCPLLLFLSLFFLNHPFKFSI